MFSSLIIGICLFPLVFVAQAWKKYHGEDVDPKVVKWAICSKLSTETRAMQVLSALPQNGDAV